MNDVLLLLSVILNVTATLLDKHSSTQRSAWDCTYFGVLFQFLCSLALIGFYPMQIQWDWVPCLGLILVGMITASARTSWYTALQKDALTRLAPFRKVSTLFTLILGVWVLNEKAHLKNHEILGALVMVIGGLLVSFDRLYSSMKHFLVWNRYVGYVIYFAASLALMKAVTKSALEYSAISVLGAYFLVKVGQVLFVVTKTPDSWEIKSLGPLWVSHLCQMTASLLFIFVISKQSLSLSEPIAAISPLFVMIFGRYLFGEKDKKFGYRMSASLIMILGYAVMKNFQFGGGE